MATIDECLAMLVLLCGRIDYHISVFGLISDIDIYLPDHFDRLSTVERFYAVLNAALSIMDSGTPRRKLFTTTVDSVYARAYRTVKERLTELKNTQRNLLEKTIRLKAITPMFKDFNLRKSQIEKNRKAQSELQAKKAQRLEKAKKDVAKVLEPPVGDSDEESSVLDKRIFIPETPEKFITPKNKPRQSKKIKSLKL